MVSDGFHDRTRLADRRKISSKEGMVDSGEGEKSESSGGEAGASPPNPVPKLELGNEDIAGVLICLAVSMPGGHTGPPLQKLISQATS